MTTLPPIRITTTIVDRETAAARVDSLAMQEPDTAVSQADPRLARLAPAEPTLQAQPALTVSPISQPMPTAETANSMSTAAQIPGRRFTSPSPILTRS